MTESTDLLARIASLPPEKRALLEARLLREKAGAALPAIPRRAGSGPAPLSFAQQRLWFLDQLDPGQPHYNLPLAVRLTGELDAGALTRALDAIVARHEVLRTVYVAKQGEALQVVGPVQPLAVERRDLSGLTEEARAAALQRLLADELARPFDLARDAMIRATLVREAEDRRVLVLMMHHIASDGWSIGVLFQEFAALYGNFHAGAEPDLSPLPIQYADYAVWQREWLRGGIEQNQLAHWKKQLEGELPVLQLPADRPRPSRQTFSGAQERRLIALGLTERLEAISREAGATLFMTLLAAFQTLLSRLSGQEDILVGTPVAGRGRVETEDLIGFFVNTLVMRGDLSGNPTFREMVSRVRERALGAYANQDLPFEKLVEALHPDRDPTHPPVFQAMFAFENDPAAFPNLPGLTVENVEFETIVSNFDLAMDVSRRKQGLAVSLEYNTDLFDRETARRWLSSFEVLLSGIAAEPDRSVWELPVLTESERERLLLVWNATDAPFPAERCIHELFEERAAGNPEATAAEADGEVLSYAELEQQSNVLAHRLRALGVGPEVAVGVCLPRSLDLAVAVLGVLKAGGAYVPLEPSYPAGRLRYFLEDSGARVLLTDPGRSPSLGEGPWKTLAVAGEGSGETGSGAPQPHSGVRPENLAYIVYTSGSTGQPKGVMVAHRSVVNHATAIRGRYHLSSSDRVLQFAAFSFDVAAEEIFPTWAAGGAVLFRPDETVGVAEFERMLEKRRPTVVNLPAGFWHQWVLELEKSGRSLPTGLRLVVAGSERAMPERLAWWRRHVSRSVRWLNAYGPSETTITATLYEPGEGDPPPSASVPIGRPISNVRLYVVDRHGQLCPQGAVGELWIGGEGVARGYRGDSERTAERFPADPFSPSRGRVYRTGDRVRYLADGNLEFLGRLDEQVKIRGFRIELGEIEAVLEQCPGVREAAVAAKENDGLAAYFVAGSPQPAASVLRAFLKERLPIHMVPVAFVSMESLPRGASGKVDKRRLPEPDRSGEGEKGFVAPRTPVEETVARIWCDLLRAERVGVHENFFDLGGHSLLATQVVSRLRDAFGFEVPLRTLFESPTIAELSLAIAQAGVQQSTPEDVARMLEELEEKPSDSRPT